jgi:hypothetical protein
MCGFSSKTWGICSAWQKYDAILVTTLMTDWLSSGRLIDIVIVITLLEGAFLLALHRKTGRGVAPRDFVLNMASGLCLMLALRLALSGVGWQMTALCLMAAGSLHAMDIYRRWNATDK